MTREHLVEDIRNVLAIVRDAAGPREERVTEARRALNGLYTHVRNESDVPGQVEGCLKESVDTVNREDGVPDASAWAHIRACLESALDFASS